MKNAPAPGSKHKAFSTRSNFIPGEFLALFHNILLVHKLFMRIYLSCIYLGKQDLYFSRHEAQSARRVFI